VHDVPENPSTFSPAICGQVKNETTTEQGGTVSVQINKETENSGGQQMKTVRERNDGVE
jgi:hypothetical protein